MVKTRSMIRVEADEVTYPLHIILRCARCRTQCLFASRRRGLCGPEALEVSLMALAGSQRKYRRGNTCLTMNWKARNLGTS